MCEVCRIEGLDFNQINGPKHRKVRRPFRSDNGKATLDIVLCYVHDIEYFVLGNKKFFERYKKFAAFIKNRLGKEEEDIFS